MRVYKTNRCKIRRDLGETRVPIGEYCLTWGSKRTWQYRWIDDNTFQIKECGKWLDANSIDFDFLNEVIS